MKIRHIKCLMPILALLAGPALADDLSQASQDACDQMKRCTLEQLGPMIDSMPPETQAMLTGQIENSCKGMRKEAEKTPRNHPLEKSGTACMRSIADLSCAEWQNLRGTTPECEEHRKKAKEHGYAQ